MRLLMDELSSDIANMLPASGVISGRDLGLEVAMEVAVDTSNSLATAIGVLDSLMLADVVEKRELTLSSKQAIT
jgi:hypothetical protein